MLPVANVQIIGNLGGEPETKYTSGGAMMVEFSVAVSKRIGQDEVTNWYRATAWGKLAEILDSQAAEGRFAKGSQAFVSGGLVVREYTKKNGDLGYSLDVRADTVTFNEPRGSAPAPAPARGSNIDLDDVPF